MSGGLDDSPLHLPYPSPKRGLPLHSSQQPAPHSASQKVTTNQQEGPDLMSRKQKTPPANGAVHIAANVVKLAGDTKPLSQSSTTTKSVSESQRKEKTMPKVINEPEHVSSVTEETKPTYRKGTTEPIVATKDEIKDFQRSRYYEVILSF